MSLLKGHLWVSIINSKKIFNPVTKVTVKCCHGFEFDIHVHWIVNSPAYSQSTTTFHFFACVQVSGAWGCRFCVSRLVMVVQRSFIKKTLIFTGHYTCIYPRLSCFERLFPFLEIAFAIVQIWWKIFQRGSYVQPFWAIPIPDVNIFLFLIHCSYHYISLYMYTYMWTMVLINIECHYCWIKSDCFN